MKRLIALCCLALASNLAAAQSSAASQTEQRVLRGYIPYEKKQYANAAKLFLQAAKAGVRAAQYNYAVMILRGETKKTQTSQDLQEAVTWLRKSANAGFPEAQYALGKLYDDGELLVQDRSIAVSWFEKAGEQRNLDALLELIAANMIGRGTAQNYARAATYAQAAAELNDGGAQYLLASLYEHGTGVPQDLATAMAWYARAARNGDPTADFKAKEIAEKIRRQDEPSTPPPPAPAASGAVS
jgi:uncharacterized protein